VAATQIEREQPDSYRRTDRAPEPKHPVEDRLAVRRQQVRSLRHALVKCDSGLSAVIALVLLLTGRDLAVLTVGAVWLAAVARAYGADGARAIVAVLPVLKTSAGIGAVACAWVALAGSRSTAHEVLWGTGVTCAALALPRLVVRTPWLSGRYGFGQRRRLVVGDPVSLESTAARRAPLVASGQVILAVTRAEPPSADEAAPGAHALRPRADQRRRQEDRTGPSGLVKRIVSTALDNGVERVTVVPGESWGQQQLRELSWLLEDTGIDMVISTNLDGIAPHRVDVIAQDGRLAIRLGSASPRGAQALLKDVVDRVTAALLLTLLAPLFALIMLAVRLDSPGSPLFRQTRVRARGATFTMVKFRTMHVDAGEKLAQLQALNMHAEDGPLFKMADDPRITRVGKLLRKTSLDELPQLVNVLRGEMSLIGPRPALPVEVELYDYVARRRLAVKPGMTGLWQVSGRSRLSWDESIGFDLDYVDNWSPAADAAIAVRTFRAVMTQDGAF
jgi:exopolysaccharide biosynthesis polyprenyl glycosylphosphotransferase